MVKVKRPAVPQVGADLRGETLAEHVNGRLNFCVANHLIPLLQRVGFEPLPGQAGVEEGGEGAMRCFTIHGERERGEESAGGRMLGLCA